MIEPGTAGWIRAHNSYYSPPDYPDSQIQIEGLLEVGDFSDLRSLEVGDLEEISIIDAGFDPETNSVKIWITGWLACSPDGEWDRKRIGDVLKPEVVDTDGVDFGPDPDEEWDNREDF